MPTCLIVASHFPPFQSAGVFRTMRIAKYLPEHGWDLDVLTLNPDAYLHGTSIAAELLDQIPSTVRIHRTTAKHPNQWFATAKAWLGKNGTKRPKEAGSPRDCALPELTSSSSSHRTSIGLIQRAKDAVTVPLMTPDRWIGWMPFAVGAGRRILRSRHIDVLYSSGPPWTNHLVAERLKRATKTPWVADFRDPWVGNNFRPQRRGDSWSGRRHRTLERRVMETADVLIFNTRRACNEAISRFPELPTGKFRVITNAFDPDDFPDAGQRSKDALPTGPAGGRSQCESSNRRPMRIVHTGAFYGKRNVDALLYALGQLLREDRIAPAEIQVDLIGAARPGRTQEQDIVHSCGLSGLVNILPPVAHERCLHELVEADVLLLVQTDAPLCVPGKLYEYIAVGKPILTLTADGATADIVNEYHLGPCVAPSETEQLATAVCELLRQHQTDGMPGPDGSAASRFNGRIQMRDFAEAFQAATSGSLSPPVISDRR